MPKETFLKLNNIQQEVIIEAFLYEFSHQLFEVASITSVVKKLGIAKGSIYQYFEDKLDLYLYLKELSEQVKMDYIMHFKREDYPNFWEYYRALYAEGLKFDLEHPLKSRFLYNIAHNEHAPALKDLLQGWKHKALTIIAAMIEKEITMGNFRQDVPIKTMAYFLFTVSASIAAYMQTIHLVDFNKNLASNKRLLEGNEQVLLQSIDEYILLLKNAFNKYSND